MKVLKKQNKTALVTGATSGIGLELAKLFAQDGYDLVIVSRKQDALDKTKEKLEKWGGNITTISKDLFMPESAFELYEEVTSKGITVTILVNAAGQGYYGEFINTDIRRELSIINLNVCSLVTLTKLFANDMVKNKDGKILNLSSVASKTPGPFQSVYHASKAFVQSFTEAIREEVKDKGIVVTALLPGMTNTDFFNKAGMQEAKSVKEGEMADPAEVAKDGYKALMAGDDKVVSGFKNKMRVVMSNILSDSMLAGNMYNRQKPESHTEADKSTKEKTEMTTMAHKKQGLNKIVNKKSQPVLKAIVHKKDELNKAMYRKAKPVLKSIMHKKDEVGKVMRKKAKPVLKGIVHKKEELSKTVHNKAKPAMKTVAQKKALLHKIMRKKHKPAMKTMAHRKSSPVLVKH